MTIDKFTKIITTLQKIQNRSLDLYRNYNIDLFDYEEDFHTVIGLLSSEAFTEEQKDWTDWFCYENDFGEKKLEAKDKDGNLICQNIEELYTMLYKTE